MKHLIIILAAIAFLFVAATEANAARRNRIVNGSFEQGFDGWEMHDQFSLAPGLCGEYSANLERAFARQVGYKLRGGKKYKLVFWYKGLVNVSVTNGEYQQATEWTRFVRKFTAERAGDTVWFMGFENNPLLVDCVKLKRVK